MPQKQTDGTEPFLQAYAPSCLIRQIMRWLLLASLLILDNVARLLNVQDEMNQLSKKHSKEKYQHENEHDGDESETFFGSSTTVSSISSSSTSSSQKKARAHFIKHDKNNGSSGATHRSTTCTTPDPQTIYPSPPPSSPLVSSSSTSLHPPVRRVREKCISFPTTILSKQQQQISHEKSSAITKSTQQTGRHTRSISTSSTRSKRNSPKSSLYLSSSPTINQSRSTVLKETTAWVHKKQAHPYSTTSSAITSTSGSSCESVRQNIKNKRSSTEVSYKKKSRNINNNKK
jgi:hypothetical protein